MTEKLDTSTLGPVRVEHDADAARAKLVRDALNATAKGAIERDQEEAALWLELLAERADDTTLACLGRMLK